MVVGLDRPINYPYERYSMSRVGISPCTHVVATELTINYRFINNFIRADTRNQLLLRMNMREEDRETIRAAGRGVEDTTPITILNRKMARERIYIAYKVDL